MTSPIRFAHPRRALATAAVLLSFCGGSAFAADAPPPTLNSGDTAWMLVSTALVLFMTIPALGLFYAGLVRAKNALSVMMQCFIITALVSVLWAVFGYSFAFFNADAANPNPWIGGAGNLFLKAIKADSLSGTIPESVFMIYQMTFAIITPALIIGAFAERMKFSAMLVFMGLWLALVYVPVAHWVWGGGWLMKKGVLDFAGGTVVHINAGIAALMSALVLGKRKGYPTTPMPPHSLMFTVTGAAMLWVGWFGFNAGSALAANGTAGMAMVATHLATAGATLTWMIIEWMKNGKPSALGAATGAVAGLVAVTPAAGTAGPLGGIAIGVIAAIICFFASTTMKRKFGYDDSLDAFGVHGVGGFTGAILTGVFASSSLGGSMPDLEIGKQVGLQFLGAGVTVVYSGIISFILLKLVDALIGLRVSIEQETEGLDLALHDERSYNL